MKKRLNIHSTFILFMISMVAVFLLLPSKANAFAVKGKCGPDAEYIYDSYSKVLTVKGTGPMYNRTHSSDGGWLPIEWGSFEIDQLVIEEGITHIGDGVFLENNLEENNNLFTEIIIPKSCTSIGKFAFKGCTKVEKVSLPEGLISIGECAFYGMNSLKSITVPSTVTYMGGEAFAECHSLVNITVNCPVVANMAFSAEYDTIPNTVVKFGSKCTTIGEEAFVGHDYPGRAVVIPSTIKTIKAHAFCYDVGDDPTFLKKGITIVGAKGSAAFNYAKKYGFTFRINGYKAPKIKSCYNVKTRRIYMKWSRDKSASGYIVQYSRSKTFASGNKSYTITKNKTTSKKTGKLTKKKYYYIRIRAYRTISGKRCYSSWSSAKRVYIKK